MSNAIGGLFNFSDRLQMESMNQRQVRQNVIASNIANAETPGFRAIGYDFEEQLQTVAGTNEPIGLNVSNPKHLKNAFADADGKIKPDVYVRPTESIGEDGNTVDIDREMVEMAKNQVLYRSSIDIINRKIGMIKYAINGGR